MIESGHIPYSLAGQTLMLLPEKAIFWVEKKALLIADLHLGKAAHFRKSGIAVPTPHKNLETLKGLFQKWEPLRVLFLGDLFHSDHNASWETFGEFIQPYPISFELVKGNHDILPEDAYKKFGIKVYQDTLEESPFLFSHIPFTKDDLPKDAGYILAGHIHPGIRLRGGARQSLRLPCFHFGTAQGLLPAFGEFTGLHVVRPRHNERVFAIADGEVIGINARSHLNF